MIHHNLSREKKPCKVGSIIKFRLVLLKTMVTTFDFYFRTTLSKMSVAADEFLKDIFSCFGVPKSIFRQSRVFKFSIFFLWRPPLGLKFNKSKHKFSQCLSAQWWHGCYAQCLKLIPLEKAWFMALMEKDL